MREGNSAANGALYRRICRRRAALFLTLMMLCACLTACVSTASGVYEQGEYYLAVGEYSAAAEMFDSLRDYRDAGEQAMYARALQALADGKFDKAAHAFGLLENFRSSRLYVEYALARAEEAAGRLESAALAYEMLGGFRDAAVRLRACEKTLSADTAEKNAAMYKAAASFAAADRLKEAYDAYIGLGAYRDSAAQAVAVRERLLALAEESLERGTLSGARDAIAYYAALPQDAVFAAAHDAVSAAYARTLALIDGADTHPYLRMGAYPQGADGARAPVTYRVLNAESGALTLISDAILDVMPISGAESYAGFVGSDAHAWLNGTFLYAAFTEAERALLLRGTDGVVSLPTLALTEDSGGGLDTWAERRAFGTPYALGKGLRAADGGEGWWWLSDKGTENGRAALVYFNGYVYEAGLPASETGIGVRPVVRLDIGRARVLDGDGSRENPYVLFDAESELDGPASAGGDAADEGAEAPDGQDAYWADETDGLNESTTPDVLDDLNTLDDPTGANEPDDPPDANEPDDPPAPTDPNEPDDPLEPVGTTAPDNLPDPTDPNAQTAPSTPPDTGINPNAAPNADTSPAPPPNQNPAPAPDSANALPLAAE